MYKTVWTTFVLLNTFICYALVLDVNIDLPHPVSTTGPKYIGVTIDTSFLVGPFSSLDISSAKLQAVARALSPGYVRVGGTEADAVIFSPTLHGQRNITLGPTLLKKLWSFLQNAGWDLIFDVNVLLRKGSYWDPSNARELLKFFSQNNVSIPCFQLGNEPNIFPEKYNTSVSPQALAQDYETFRTLLNESPLYRNSCVLGPEVPRITYSNTEEYFRQFLQAGGGKALSAVGVHHYVCLGHPPVTLGFFTNVTVMESLRDELEIVTALSRQYVPQLKVWLDETGTTFNGCPGETGIRLTYANGFLWLDKLGMSALYGIQHLNRQDFFRNLLDIDFNPLPDYYLTVLYKSLVQGPVFKVLTSTRTVRLYAHCANNHSYPSGAVVLYALNLENIDVTLTFSQFRGQQLDLYMLTPGDSQGILTSNTVALNGKRLVMTGSELPPLSPKITTGNSFAMAAKTFGFVVLPHANVQACIN